MSTPKKNKDGTTKPRLLYIDEFGEAVYEPVRTKTELSKPVQSQELNRILADQNRMQQGQMSAVVAPVTNNTSIGGGTTYAGETRPSTLNERVYGTGFVNAVP